MTSDCTKFNSANAKEALIEVLNTLNEDVKLKQIKESCSNDMLKYVQTFLPLAMDLQFKVIKKYGFSQNNEGLMQFTNKVKDIAQDDRHVANLFENFKNLLIPPLNLRTQNV